MDRISAHTYCAGQGGALAQVYSRVQVMDLVARGVITLGAAGKMWLALSVTNTAATVIDLGMIAVSTNMNGTSNYTDGSIPLSKFMPTIGEIDNSTGPISGRAVSFRVDMASPITQTPQVYSALLSFEQMMNMNYALCEKVAYGGKRYMLVTENEAISPTLNVQLGVAAGITTTDDYACGFTCMKTTDCRSYTFNLVTRACKFYAVPTQYMPYNFTIDESNTRIFDLVLS